MTERSRARQVLGVLVGGALLVSACSGSSSDAGTEPTTTSTSSAAVTSTTEAPKSTATAADWDRIDGELAKVGPEVGLLVAEVAPDGTCRPIHELAPDTVRPIGSQFKLFVLGALAEEIVAGERSWEEELVTGEATRSVGNGKGSLQFAEPGTSVSVEYAASRMIAISDNTATDMLLGLIGRDRVEATAREWVDDPARNEPFLTTRQMLLLHYVPDLGDRYLATPPDDRDEFLADEVDPRPMDDISLGYTDQPRLIDSIEWFASPNDICRAFGGLHVLAADPALEPLSDIVSGDVRALDLDESTWPTVWYKGGSEPGVLTLGWLATDDEGRSVVVEMMVTDTEAPLPDDAILRLVALAEEAYGLVGPTDPP